MLSTQWNLDSAILGLQECNIWTKRFETYDIRCILRGAYAYQVILVGELTAIITLRNGVSLMQRKQIFNCIYHNKC